MMVLKFQLTKKKQKIGKALNEEEKLLEKKNQANNKKKKVKSKMKHEKM